MNRDEEATSSDLSKKGGHAKRNPIDDLSVSEFRARFDIPDDVSITFSSTENVQSINVPSGNAVIFTKEHFVAGLRFPIPSLMKQFLYLTEIPPAFLHLNAIRILINSSVIDMLFQLDLTLVKLLAVYTIRLLIGTKFSISTQLPSLGFVTNLPNSFKGIVRGHVLVSGRWYGSKEGPDNAFAPKYSLDLPSEKLRGRLVEWFDKTTADRLSRLYEIEANDWNCEVLLTRENLRALTQNPKPFVIPLFPRVAQDKFLDGVHFVLDDLDFYAIVEVYDYEARLKKKEDREAKRRESKLRKAPGAKGKKLKQPAQKRLAQPQPKPQKSTQVIKWKKLPESSLAGSDFEGYHAGQRIPLAQKTPPVRPVVELSSSSIASSLEKGEKATPTSRRVPFPTEEESKNEEEVPLIRRWASLSIKELALPLPSETEMLPKLMAGMRKRAEMTAVSSPKGSTPKRSRVEGTSSGQSSSQMPHVAKAAPTEPQAAPPADHETAIVPAPAPTPLVALAPAPTALPAETSAVASQRGY